MKNIKLLALAFLVLSMGLVSCSSDDDWNNNPEAADVIGNWEAEDRTILVNGKVIYFENILDPASCMQDLIEFKADNTTKEVYLHENSKGECLTGTYTDFWELKGQTLYMNLYEGVYEEEYLASRKGKYLKLTETEIADEYFIQYFEEDYGATDHKFVLGEEVTLEYSFRIK